MAISRRDRPRSSASSNTAASPFPLVADAYRSFRRGEYRDTVLLLEKIVEAGGRSPYPIFLSALALLMTSQFARADALLKRIRALSPEYIPARQLEAFLFMKSSPAVEPAISAYIDLVNRFPADRTLRRTLGVLRRVRDFTDFQQRARIADFVDIPRPRKADYARTTGSYGFEIARRRGRFPAPGIGTIAIVGIILLIAGAGAFVAVRFDDIRNSIAPRIPGVAAPSHRIDTVTLDASGYDLIETLNRTRKPVFYYSSDEIASNFANAKMLIKKERYNEALSILNAINNSNANLMVKERVEFLIGFVNGVDNRAYESVPYREVEKSPYRYTGYAVLWKGKVANLARTQGRRIFNLLVDYRETNEFAGVAEVYSEDVSTPVENGDLIMVKGLFMYKIGSENRAYLVAKEITKQ